MEDDVELARELQKFAEGEMGMKPKLKDCVNLVRDADAPFPMEPTEVYIVNLFQRWESVLRASAKDRKVCEAVAFKISPKDAHGRLGDLNGTLESIEVFMQDAGFDDACTYVSLARTMIEKAQASLPKEKKRGKAG